MVKFFWLFLVTAIASYGLTVAVRRVALRHGLMDEPNRRSSHTWPTPRGGGFAIVTVFTVAIAGAWLRFDLISSSLAIALLAGSVLVAAIGYLDDRSDVPAAVRLGVHVVAVIIAFSVTGGLLLAGIGLVALAWQALAGLVCLWFINLFNFMDGIDGIAAMEATFISVAAAVLLATLEAPLELTLSWIALAGACGGFLVYNWPPARIFMGDTGSGFLGFVIAILLVVSTHVPGFTPWTAAILVSAFAADATVTLARRIVRGEEWHQPHRSHAYQRLARRWRSHGRVTVLYFKVNCFAVFPAAAASVVIPALAPTLAATVLGGLAWLAWRAGAGLPD